MGFTFLIFDEFLNVNITMPQLSYIILWSQILLLGNDRPWKKIGIF